MLPDETSIFDGYDTSEIDLSLSYKSKSDKMTTSATLPEKNSSFSYNLKSETSPFFEPVSRFQKTQLICETKKDALGAFELFMTRDIKKFIILQINKNIAKRRNNNTSSRYSYIQDTRELDILLGIIFLLGLVDVYNYKALFDKNSPIYNEFISGKMTCHRFSFLYSNFSMFTSKDKKDGYMVKEPVFLNRFNHLSQIYKEPGENICIDEALCDFKGRVLNRVYAPQKPAKFGIKMYVCCDSSSAYILNTRICGVKTRLEDTVLDLSKGFEKEWRILHMDNFYNSVKISEELLKIQIHSNGTIRRNKSFENKILDRYIQPNDCEITRISEEISCLSFNDNKRVDFISTVYKNEICSRDKKQWTKNKSTGRKESTLVKQKIPLAVLEYNSHMNGVDKANQCIKMFNLKRSSQKWTRKLSVHILEMFLHNSFILYDQSSNDKKFNRTEFLEILSKKLLTFSSDKSKYSKHQSDCSSQLYRRCYICFSKGLRSETNHKCLTCNKYMHPGACFHIHVSVNDVQDEVFDNMDLI